MTHGGKRLNAGRPKGCGPYQESTKPMRIPISMIDRVKTLLTHKSFALPLFGCKISAGFPSPTDDHYEKMIDLQEHLIENPAATFLVRVSGTSMIGAGIYPNDLLIVDRSVIPTHGKIVIAMLDGDFTVKRLEKKNKRIRLIAENPEYPPIEIKKEQALQIWGVVIHVIHSV